MGEMEEAVIYGVVVALVMLGVPLLHSMGECRRGRLVKVHLCRWWLLCGFMVMLSLMVAVFFGVAGFVLQNSAPPKAPRLSADCRIVAKGVDIRSAKVCDARNVSHLQTSGQTSNAPPRFRCSLEYYWAAVLQVEYMPLASKSAVEATAEVPSGALPSNCRPSFGSAWRTKEDFQINETYPCKYSFKNLKVVDITIEKAGNCSSENEPTNLDLIKQIWYLLVHSENSLFSPSGKIGDLMTRAAAAVGLGICYSMIITGFTKTIGQVHFQFGRDGFSDLDVVYFEARIQLAIFLAALLYGVIWFSNHLSRDDIDVDLFNKAL